MDARSRPLSQGTNRIFPFYSRNDKQTARRMARCVIPTGMLRTCDRLNVFEKQQLCAELPALRRTRALMRAGALRSFGLHSVDVLYRVIILSFTELKRNIACCREHNASP